MESKKIVFLVISLLVLSMFSSSADALIRPLIAGDGAGSDVPVPVPVDLIIQEDVVVTVEQPEDTSEDYDLGEISSCTSVELERGDTATFFVDGSEYVIRPSFVGSLYAQIELNPGSFSDRFYIGDSKEYGILEITLDEISGEKAYLEVCASEETSQEVTMPALETISLDSQPGEAQVAEETVPADENLQALTGEAVKQQDNSNSNKLFVWISALVIAVAAVLAFVFRKRK